LKIEWKEVDNNGVEILNNLGEQDGLIPLLYSNSLNGEESIRISTKGVTYELTDSIHNIKSIFLVSYANGNGYIMA